MERASSPSSSNAYDSQDLGRPRRSVASYRLFPTVGPTPPASPVTLQKTSLNKAGPSSRRRSSSDENGPKVTALASASLATLPSTTFVRDSRKASLPELRPLRTVQENNDQDAPHHPPPRRLRSAMDVRASQDDNAYNRPNSDPAKESLADEQRAADGNSSSLSVSPGRRISTRPLVSASRLQNRSLPQTSQVKSKRSKPNLRITVEKRQRKDDELPPDPPPKSPRHRHEESAAVNSSPQPRGRSSPVSPLFIGPTIETLRTPPGTQVAQQQSFVPVGSQVTVRELTVSPSAARGRAVRRFLPKMHSIFPIDHAQRDAERNGRPLHSTFNASTNNLRPSTSGALTASSNSALRASSVPRNRSVEPLTARSIMVPPRAPPKTNVGLRPPSRENATTHGVVASPVSSRGNEESCPSFPPSEREVRVPAQYAPRPVPTNLVGSQTNGSAHESIADVVRKHTAAQAASDIKHDTAFAPQQRVFSNPAAAESSKRTALAQARANVAALGSFDSFTTSPSASEQHRSYGSELNAFNRAFTADKLSRRPSSPSNVDPVETLKSLSDQCEALHARYASLRADRQKISCGIIANLKEQKPGPEYTDMLMAEQLSLAAVSSSMDICFAKLKSLECRKEDAVQVLISRATQPKPSSSDHIAAMIASMAMARKPSLATSTESGSRGHSTSEIGGSPARSTQSSLPRTHSYASETTSQEYRLSGISRHSSIGHDVVQTEKQAPETIPEAVESPLSPKHQPDEAKRKSTDGPLPDGKIQSPLADAADISFGRGSDQNIGHDVSPISDDGLPEDLFDLAPNKRIRVNGAKAAQILGLISKNVDGKESPLIKLPDELKDINPAKLHAADEVEFELLPRPGKAHSIKSSHSRATDPDSPAIHDLEAQLENFPKPVTPLVTMRSAASLPKHGKPQATDASATKLEDEERRRRHDSPMNNIMTSRKNSHHTIQVYMEPDEILDLYRRGSAATTASVS